MSKQKMGRIWVRKTSRLKKGRTKKKHREKILAARIMVEQSTKKRRKSKKIHKQTGENVKA